MKIVVKGEDYLASQKAIERINKKCEDTSAKILLPGYKECECSQCGTIFPRFYASKSKVCCACMLTNKKIKAGEIVKVQTGYPKTTALQSIEELEAYYSSEKITCLLCGNEYKTLSHTHLENIHGVTAREYKTMFGLYLSIGLLGRATKKIYSDRMRLRLTPELKEAVVSKLHQSNKENPPTNPGYSHSPALIKKQKASMRQSVRSNIHNHVTSRKNIVPAQCSRCGAIIQVSESTAITKRCILLCGPCKGIRHKESQQRWADKNGIDLKQFQAECARRNYLKRKRKNPNLPTEEELNKNK